MNINLDANMKNNYYFFNILQEKSFKRYSGQGF